MEEGGFTLVGYSLDFGRIIKHTAQKMQQEQAEKTVIVEQDEQKDYQNQLQDQSNVSMHPGMILLGNQNDKSKDTSYYAGGMFEQGETSQSLQDAASVVHSSNQPFKNTSLQQPTPRLTVRKIAKRPVEPMRRSLSGDTFLDPDRIQQSLNGLIPPSASGVSGGGMLFYDYYPQTSISHTNTSVFSPRTNSITSHDQAAISSQKRSRTKRSSSTRCSSNRIKAACYSASNSSSISSNTLSLSMGKSEQSSLMDLGGSIEMMTIRSSSYSRLDADARRIDKTQTTASSTESTTCSVFSHPQYTGCRYDKDKPAYSYASLIAQAILDAPERKLTLNQIYAWIMDKYPYYRSQNSGWQVAISLFILFLIFPLEFYQTQFITQQMLPQNLSQGRRTRKGSLLDRHS